MPTFSLIQPAGVPAAKLIRLLTVCSVPVTLSVAVVGTSPPKYSVSSPTPSNLYSSCTKSCKWFNLWISNRSHLLKQAQCSCANSVRNKPSTRLTSIRMATTAEPGTGGMNGNDCLRCLGIKGDHDKANDVVFCGKPNADSNIIFFGGDVQDFSENMLAHRDNKRYEEWNLEATAKLLQERFSNSHIWVIRPSKMHLKTFSCFAHFVESNPIGCPDHLAGQRSWHHLYRLLKNAAEKVTEEFGNTPSDSSNPNPSADLPVELVGFSKGCVVLNQLLYDLGDARRDEATKGFVEQVRKFHWLDGGHNGGSNTWITDEVVLQNMKGLNIKVAVHVTPYQVKDPMRLWIGKEQKKFVDKLRKCGIDVMNTLHFANMERSLDLHFNVLNKF